MKRQNFITGIFILYILGLCCAVRHYTAPAYADNGESKEYEYQMSDTVSSGYSRVVPNNRYGNHSDHKDFLKFALSLNEVNHGESDGNAVQRMREHKLEMPAYWFYAEGWQELTLDQKRTLVAGCVYFMNRYLREAICFNGVGVP